MLIEGNDRTVLWPT